MGKGTTPIGDHFVKDNRTGLIYNGVSLGYFWGEPPTTDDAVFLSSEQTMIALYCAIIKQCYVLPLARGEKPKPPSAEYIAKLAKYIGAENAQVVADILTEKKKVSCKDAANMTLKQQVEYMRTHESRKTIARKRVRSR
jgi:hypothetical protein